MSCFITTHNWYLKSMILIIKIIIEIASSAKLLINFENKVKNDIFYWGTAKFNILSSLCGQLTVV